MTPAVWWPRGTFPHIVAALIMYSILFLGSRVVFIHYGDSDVAFGVTQGIACGVPAFSNADVISEEYNWIIADVHWCGAQGSSLAKQHQHLLKLDILNMTSSSSDIAATTDNKEPSRRGALTQNTNNDKPCSQPLTISVKRVAIYTGMRWQCVEYARRFLIVRNATTFGDVDGAEDIWALPHFLEAWSGTLADGQEEARPHPIVKYYAQNCTASTSTIGSGAGKHAMMVATPALGDVIIWKRQQDMPYGHVGVVVGSPTRSTSMDKGQCAALVGSKGSCSCHDVPIGEQNYAATLWPLSTARRSIARNLTLVTCSTEHISIPQQTFLDGTGYELIGFIRPSTIQ
ncbi:D-alanyl-glycyl endopeptidase-like protein, putative [Bodo saltans]|uniref:D-alanyl-glycyl endopeptidase-like protein, putative n=1 Tax=Bodo saltans TaxID=75058 RepID=A0A0S4IP47_BODSA|nr:D-alanyl-glycyl endopeptidase-like protein, putative [Bodo saltans]|eukprot:CUF79015.1 D-alanyl-glycyl endopeptidase-like protein, putative [Bodo saltans]